MELGLILNGIVVLLVKREVKRLFIRNNTKSRERLLKSLKKTASEELIEA